MGKVGDYGVPNTDGEALAEWPMARNRTTSAVVVTHPVADTDDKFSACCLCGQTFACARHRNEPRSKIGIKDQQGAQSGRSTDFGFQFQFRLPKCFQKRTFLPTSYVVRRSSKTARNLSTTMMSLIYQWLAMTSSRRYPRCTTFQIFGWRSSGSSR